MVDIWNDPSYEALRTRLAPYFRNYIDLSIPVGWVKLVDDLFTEVLKIDHKVKLYQIKSKFGGLRFYFDSPYYAEIEPLVTTFEKRSYNTCEDCGDSPARDEETPRGWIYTLCTKCLTNRRARQ